VAAIESLVNSLQHTSFLNLEWIHQKFSLVRTLTSYRLHAVEAEDTPSNDPFSTIEIRSYFVRGRNALAVRGQFAPLYVDYYLHLSQHNLKLSQFQDGVMKDGLTALTLHLSSRPWNEQHAWTVHFQKPLVNLFLCGDNQTSKVTGRIFDRDVKETEQNLLFSQLIKSGLNEPRTSAIQFTGPNVFHAVEKFYEQSEQRLGRFFEYGEEDYVFITAQPQCDEAWLMSLDTETVRQMDQQEELSLLETRYYHFECGCSERRIWEVLLPHCRNGADDLFGSDEHLDVSCRRCAAHYRIQREQFEAYLEAALKPEEK
jgi:molecular chaperone Hsp33